MKKNITCLDEVDALLITNPIDLFYLTGLHLSRGFLFVEKQKSTLLVDGRYFEHTSRHHPHVLLDEDATFEKLSLIYPHIGFDKDFESFASYESLQEKLPHSELLPIPSPLSPSRMIKSPEEIEKIEAACALCAKGMEFISIQAQEGMTEKQLAKQLEIFFLQHGADGFSFPPIIASGKNSAFPHHQTSHDLIEKNQPLLVDIGVSLNGYTSDMTRTFFVGTVHPTLKQIYSYVHTAYKECVLAANEGIAIFDLYDKAKEVFYEVGMEKYFVHGLGHGLGLEVHEEPYLKRAENRSNALLQQGMVITIEPGLYIPDLGGVRIENTLLVEEEGSRVLTEYPIQEVV